MVRKRRFLFQTLLVSDTQHVSLSTHPTHQQGSQSIEL